MWPLIFKDLTSLHACLPGEYESVELDGVERSNSFQINVC